MPKIDGEVFYAKLATYRKALGTFESALKESPDKNKLYLDASSHRFIYCYELTWKNLRRLLKMRGIQANSPVLTFRNAYAEGWIDNKDLYQKMIEDRNTVTHEYFEEKLWKYITDCRNISWRCKDYLCKLKKSINKSRKNYRRC